MITDRSFDADGSLLYPSIDPTLVNQPGVRGRYVAGVLGDVMLVNGTAWPVATVDRGRYRLRLLNACNARRLRCASTRRPQDGLTQIGTDGGLLAAPVPHDHLELAPAQRFDVVVDFSGYPPGHRGHAGQRLRHRGDGPRSCASSSPTADPSVHVPDRLSTITPLRPAGRRHDPHLPLPRRRRPRLTTAGSSHGRRSAPTPSPPHVRLGTVEIWRLIADFHHPVHIHLSPFQVLARGSDGPGPYDAGWKDTIDLRPGEQAAIPIHFDGYPGKYVFHCHNLEHEDMAMMANFVTT